MTHGERKERRRLIAEDIKSGLSSIGVATKHGVAVDLVRKSCAEFSVTFVVAMPKVSVRSFQILARLMNLDKSIYAIGRELGISPQRVHQVYQQAVEADFPGLPRRKGGFRTKEEKSCNSMSI